MANNENKIEQMIDSINCNTHVLKDLINETNNNGKIINSKMSDYAKHSKKMDKRQMSAYRAYANEMRKLKENISYLPKDKESINQLYKTQNEAEMQLALEKIHKKQVGTMEFLCDLIEKSQRVMGIFN